jgi:hypothetical protein
MFSKGQRAGEDLRLWIVRFRRLLENARRLMDLAHDGREKAGGDYIFDRQYVVALVEEAVDQAGQLVFNAHVLSPEGSDVLYRLYDDCRRLAQELLSSPAGHKDGVEDLQAAEDIQQTPEFRLLAAVNRWLDGPGDPGEPSLPDLLSRTFDHVFRGLDTARNLHVVTHPFTVGGPRSQNRIELVDLDGPSSRTGDAPGSIQNLHCKPLELMILGARQEDPDDGSPATGTPQAWLAAIRGDQLSLFSLGSEPAVHSEAALTGHAAADFVFLITREGAGLQDRMPPGWTGRKTDQSRLFWSYDVPSRDLEDKLIHLGRTLFCGTLTSP